MTHEDREVLILSLGKGGIQRADIEVRAEVPQADGIIESPRGISEYRPRPERCFR